LKKGQSFYSQLNEDEEDESINGRGLRDSISLRRNSAAIDNTKIYLGIKK
jgi:hypothetical protein